MKMCPTVWTVISRSHTLQNVIRFWWQPTVSLPFELLHFSRTQLWLNSKPHIYLSLLFYYEEHSHWKTDKTMQMQRCQYAYAWWSKHKTKTSASGYKSQADIFSFCSVHLKRGLTEQEGIVQKTTQQQTSHSSEGTVTSWTNIPNRETEWAGRRGEGDKDSRIEKERWGV